MRPYVERLTLIDEFHCKCLDLKHLTIEQALICLDEYSINKTKISKMEKIWTCRIGLHNFPDLQESTVCKECGLTVAEVKKLRRVISVKNIIMHLKLNVRRYEDEKLQKIKELIDAEYERRLVRDSACQTNSSKATA